MPAWRRALYDPVVMAIQTVYLIARLAPIVLRLPPFVVAKTRKNGRTANDELPVNSQPAFCGKLRKGRSKSANFRRPSLPYDAFANELRSIVVFDPKVKKTTCEITASVHHLLSDIIPWSRKMSGNVPNRVLFTGWKTLLCDVTWLAPAILCRYARDNWVFILRCYFRNKSIGFLIT